MTYRRTASPRRRTIAPAMLAALVAAIALASCGESPAEPAASSASIEADLAALDQDVAAVGGGQADLAADMDAFLGPHDRPSVASRSLLVALTHRALRVVASEQGPEAARELLAPILEALRQARRAREAGEFELARTLLLEARLGMARIVVRVLGPEVAVRVLEGTSERLRVLFARLEAAEAEGHELPRIRALLERAAELLRQSRRALEAGAPAPSLERSTRAADLLHHWLDA